MLFKDVIGQESVKTQLRHFVNSGRIPHAQLFLGAGGSGKLALAIAFARYVLCENRSPEDACGQCSGCTKAAKLAHPDLHFSYPFIGSGNTSNHFLEYWRKTVLDNPYQDVNQWLQEIGAENKQGNINKDECLNIIRKLSLKSFESPYKILIIWLPEYLGKEGNRLLKLIEEPPENTLFILVAENQERILNTILSRCQIVKINGLNDEEVKKGLMEREAIEETQAQTIAHLSNGNYNEAIKLISAQENDNANLFLEWMRKCYKGNGVQLVEWVETFAKIGRENQKHFLQYALHFMREYMIVKLTGQENVRLQPKELDSAVKLTNVIEVGQIDKIVKLFDACAFGVERNANPKILFLDASMQLHKILKTKMHVFQ